jgi:hypothetical protein
MVSGGLAGSKDALDCPRGLIACGRTWRAHPLNAPARLLQVGLGTTHERGAGFAQRRDFEVRFKQIRCLPQKEKPDQAKDKF